MMSGTGEKEGLEALPNDNDQPISLNFSPPQGSKGELFVFGYGCKIFRDDEKALWIDEGKHLIPWMEQKSLLIDRYDIRATLTDLPSCEILSNKGFSGGFTEKEAEIEKLCDRERYSDLVEDNECAEQEDEDLGDAGSSSLRANHYAAVGYSYTEKHEDSEAVFGPEPERSEEDADYVKPNGLNVPEDMVLPSTVKAHAIIEKTAKFIAHQGSQMEIILKTKQSNNPQFEFLNFDHPLNAYYKHLVQSIRNSSYVPDEVAASNPLYSQQKEEDSIEETLEDDDQDDEYLHPSLFSSSVSTSLPSATNFQFGNSTYSRLVSNIQKSLPPPPPPPPQNFPVNSFQISYDSTNYAEPPKRNKVMPTAQEALVIEKMAIYALKNGEAFEDLAKLKGDPRFRFLNHTHPLHWYYLNCKERLKATVASSGFVGYHGASVEGITGSPSSEYNAFEREIPKRDTRLGVSHANTIKIKPILRSLHLEHGDSKSPLTSNYASTHPRAIESGSDRKKNETCTAEKSSILTSTVNLPLSDSGIPIANVESFKKRRTVMPPQLVSRIEEINRKKMKKNLINDKERISKDARVEGKADEIKSSLGAEPSPSSTQSKEDLKKLERRKKAALFLQKLKQKQQVTTH